MNDRRPAREGRLLRLAFTLTLVGLLAALPVVVTWLLGSASRPGSSDGLAVLSAAAFAAASILFVAGGRTVGAMVALPAIAIGGLLDDPHTMALVLLVRGAGRRGRSVDRRVRLPERVLDARGRRARRHQELDVERARVGAAAPPRRGPWVLDRIAVGAASARRARSRPGPCS